ncbi:MAG: hypothetical protein JWN84_3351 [Nocardioides sp.]|jgi:hypothetical protein|nr:hypothetical protein [Nocardioides sp.]
MLRRTLLAAIASLLLFAGLLTAPPTATAIEFDNSIGKITAPDQQWRGRCARYQIRWNFNPPTDDWSVIMRIRTPKGFAVRSELFDSGYIKPDGTKSLMGREEGRKRIDLCGSSIKPGRYKINMQMIHSEGRQNITRNRAPVYFRLFRG